MLPKGYPLPPESSSDPFGQILATLGAQAQAAPAPANSATAADDPGPPEPLTGPPAGPGENAAQRPAHPPASKAAAATPALAAAPAHDPAANARAPATHHPPEADIRATGRDGRTKAARQGEHLTSESAAATKTTGPDNIVPAMAASLTASAAAMPPPPASSAPAPPAPAFASDAPGAAASAAPAPPAALPNPPTAPAAPAAPDAASRLADARAPVLERKPKARAMAAPGMTSRDNAGSGSAPAPALAAAMPPPPASSAPAPPAPAFSSDAPGAAASAAPAPPAALPNPPAAPDAASRLADARAPVLERKPKAQAMAAPDMTASRDNAGSGSAPAPALAAAPSQPHLRAAEAGPHRASSSPASGHGAHAIPQQLAAALADGKSGTTLHVALTPETLGKVTIRIERQDDGQASVTIAASQPATLAQLKKDSAELNQILTNAGVPEAGRQLAFRALPVAAPAAAGGPGFELGFGTPADSGQQNPQNGTGFAYSAAMEPKTFSFRADAVQSAAASSDRRTLPTRRGIDVIA